MTHAPQLRMLRTEAGGELYIAVGHEVSYTRGSSRPGTLWQASHSLTQ
jgi:hypothetical protein